MLGLPVFLFIFLETGFEGVRTGTGFESLSTGTPTVLIVQRFFEASPEVD